MSSNERLLPTGVSTAPVPGTAVPTPVCGGHQAPGRDDPFARQAGPDVSLVRGGVEVRVYTHFSVDPMTKEVQVAIVDQAGRLVRMIPPDSVAQMLQAMNSYGGNG